MSTAIQGTPIYWIHDRDLSIDINFAIHPISEDFEMRLIERLTSSPILAGGPIKLLKEVGAIQKVQYTYKLKEYEFEYFASYFEQIDEAIEEVIEQFVFDQGGYHLVQA
jgi:hypothetical protein